MTDQSVHDDEPIAAPPVPRPSRSRTALLILPLAFVVAALVLLGIVAALFDGVSEDGPTPPSPPPEAWISAGRLLEAGCPGEWPPTALLYEVRFDGDGATCAGTIVSVIEALDFVSDRGLIDGEWIPSSDGLFRLRIVVEDGVGIATFRR